MTTSTERIHLTYGTSAERIGGAVIRYGLAIVLIWVGLLKFTDYEAMGVMPLVENSPFLSWMLGLGGIGTAAKILGVIEILSGVLIASRSFSAKASAVGSCIAILIFGITLTLLFTTPMVWQADMGFPYLSPMPGQFLAKDLLFLGAAIWTAGEASGAARLVRRGTMV